MLNLPRSVLLLGSTGLVGRELLSLLLREPDVSSVIAPVRSTGTLPEHARLRAVQLNFDDMEAHAELFRVDQVFCALGTTMRQAGSREQFRRVDFGYPVTAARLARDHGAGHYLLVSALGANPRSRIFYNRVKGETEQAVQEIGWRQVTIARPSLLSGPRPEFRLGERVGHILGALAPSHIRPIHGRDVAAALTLAAREFRSGMQVLTSRQMRGAYSRLTLTP